MAIVTFSKPVRFPIGPMRALLEQHLPMYKWQCGEDDRGTADEWGLFREHQIISARSSATTVFTELHAWEEPLAVPAPPHIGYFRIARPTTELEPIADRIELLLAWSLLCLDEANGACQLLPDGNWLHHDDLKRVVRLVLGGESLRVAEGLGRPASQFAAAAPPVASPGAAPAATATPRGELANLPYPEMSPRKRSAILGVDTLGLAAIERSFATQLHKRFGSEFAQMCGHEQPPAYLDEKTSENRLPTMVVMLDRPLGINWPLIEEGVSVIDPQGDWVFDYDAEGNATIAGRGGTITLTRDDRPVPAYLIEYAFDRSHWFADGPERVRVRRHTGQLVLAADLDTRAAPFEDVRMTSMVATLLLGMITKEGDQPGVYNAGLETVLPQALVTSQTAILGNGEIPIQLWTWCAFHSTNQDAISASTAGMRPFTGYEVELWNAPGTLEWAMGKANNAMRYLLLKGPVIRDGDTMGEEEGDRSIRCFFGPSKAERSDPCRAMFLEFDGERGARPQPDPAVPGKEPMDSGTEDVLREFLGKVGDSDITGMSDIIRGMLSENDALRAGRPAAPGAPHPPAAPQPSPPPGRPTFGRRTGGFGRKGL